MLKSTLDDLISQESEGLCSVLRKEYNDPITFDQPDATILSIVTRLEQLIKERKNAR
jgi:hypothetical protein